MERNEILLKNLDPVSSRIHRDRAELFACGGQEVGLEDNGRRLYG